jgi:hypothetical protein
MQYAISPAVKLRRMYDVGAPPALLSATCDANVETSSTSTPRPRSVLDRIETAFWFIELCSPSVVAARSGASAGDNFATRNRDDAAPPSLGAEKLHDPRRGSYVARAVGSR